MHMIWTDSRVRGSHYVCIEKNPYFVHCNTLYYCYQGEPRLQWQCTVITLQANVFRRTWGKGGVKLLSLTKLTLQLHVYFALRYCS